jgi:hypothetical protein
MLNIQMYLEIIKLIQKQMILKQIIKRANSLLLPFAAQENIVAAGTVYPEDILNQPEILEKAK